MSVNIDFDQNWNSCHYATTDDDKLFISSITDTITDVRWSLVTLPDDAGLGEETVDVEKAEKWWYRKQFKWISPNSWSLNSLDLTFQSLGTNDKDNCHSTTRSITASVWLNAVQIFSGFIRGPQTTIRLPQQLIQSNQTGGDIRKHTLIVCCTNTSLSFHASLTIPCGSAFVDDEVQSGVSVVNSVTAIETRPDSHDYVASFDDIDERDKAVFDSTPESSASTQVTDTNEEKLQGNAQTDQMEPSSVPLLTIVMLIVGSRGDVQPFVA